jgi:hypothetical protein
MAPTTPPGIEMKILREDYAWRPRGNHHVEHAPDGALASGRLIPLSLRAGLTRTAARP